MATVLDIKKIKVVIYTNDPKNRKIDLKGTIFGFDDTFPYFSNSVLYSEEALNELMDYNIKEKRRVFFDIDLFQNFLEQSQRKGRNMTNNQNCNVKMMLDVLFKMSFPVLKTVSLASKNDPYNCPVENVDWIVSNVRGLMQERPYTHISSNSKKYTVIDTKWANTITTNPDYALGIVQAFQIYNVERQKFQTESESKIEDIMKNIKNKYGISTGFSITPNGEIFKTYVKNLGPSIFDKGINDLISQVESLQKDFVYYTYLWILYLGSTLISTKSGSGDQPGEFFTQTISNLIKNPILTENGNSKLFKTTTTQKVDDTEIQNIINEITTSPTLNINLSTDPKSGELRNFIDFFHRFLVASQKLVAGTVTGNNESNRKTLLGLKTIDDVIEFLKTTIDLSKLLPVYGFDSDKGLLNKIITIHGVIKVLSEFKADNLSTLSIQEINSLKTTVEINVKNANTYLTEKINITDLTKWLDEIKKIKELIDASTIVESSSSNTTKSEAWKALYDKKSWYKNFSRKALETSQSRRSINSAINDVIGDGNKIDTSGLNNLIMSDAEAGISEINLKESDNVLAYQINIFCILVGGEITEANRGKIHCPYTSEKLGSMLNRLMLNQPVNPDLRRADFVDLSATIKKAEEEAAKKEALKNKTQKNMKPNNGIQDLVQKTGYQNYNDQQILNMGQNLLQQPQELSGQNKKNVENSKLKLRDDVIEFIDRNFKIISDYKSTGLSTTSFDKDKIFKNPSYLTDYIKKEEPKIIPTLNDAVKMIDESPDPKKKNDLVQKINELVGKYELMIKKADGNTKLDEYKNNESKKQKNYLDLYQATIMKNLFDSILEELEQTSSSNASSSPTSRISRGGSRKRFKKRSVRKTRSLRKNNI